MKIDNAATLPSAFDATAHTTQMTIDSGATNMYLPQRICDLIASSFFPPAIYNAQSNTYTVLCSSPPPRVGVVIDGIPFYVNPEDLMGRGWWGGKGRGLCTLAVQRQGDGDAVLGDAWLKSVVAVFDVGGKFVFLLHVGIKEKLWHVELIKFGWANFL